jgi:hypothetical protein
MSHPRIVGALITMLICVLAPRGVRAQHVETSVDSAEVVYVEGNVVVLKFVDGDVKQFDITDSSKFTYEGKIVTAHELKPGMKLTAKIITVKPPQWVDSVTILQFGTVWKMVGNNMIIKTPEGQNRMYRVPAGGTITIDGMVKAVDQLHEGDKLSATVVVLRPPVEVAARARTTPATPPRVGALLIDEGEKPVESETPVEGPQAWSTTTTLLLILVVLVLAALIFVALKRKHKAVPKK